MDPVDTLKDSVRAHWEAETCGTRGVDTGARREFFDQIERERYAWEPYIKPFARFERGRGKRVLEVGVGAGTDFINGVRAGADATGVDLTARGVELTRERVALEGFNATVAQADAERLPFADASFDHAYTVTVLEECDADVALRELLRVVKPGGRVGVIVRAIDMPYPWNVDVAEDIKRKIELAPALIGPKGVADRSVYLRMRNAGFTELTCFPMLSSFDQIGGPFWSYLESRVVSRLTPDEAGAFLGAMAQAREAGVLFCCAPHHCVVGRKPV
jgi:SAM-dependent methyltransferase